LFCSKSLKAFWSNFLPKKLFQIICLIIAQLLQQAPKKKTVKPSEWIKTIPQKLQALLTSRLRSYCSVPVGGINSTVGDCVFPLITLSSVKIKNFQASHKTTKCFRFRNCSDPFQKSCLANGA